MTQTSIGPKAKQQLIDSFLSKRVGAVKSTVSQSMHRAMHKTKVPDAFTSFASYPGYEKMLVSKAVADRMGLRNPFFISHEGVASAFTLIDGREFLNFSSYNYLGLAGHPLVNKAAKEAIDRYGTSASASRLVAGERPVQRDLEAALAELYGVDDSIVFVSGHATNVSTIGCLFGPKDLVIHDSFIHNSVIEGVKLSGAIRRSFPHNDTQALEAILLEIRQQFERVLIVVEGHYSMDGDIPNLLALIDIKRRYGCFLMVDEAHSLGVLGAKGKGSHEHFNVAGKDVDIWMGTLSKTLASCGGYIAGERALIEHLKYAAPGFVYSVGIAPALAAASLAALKIMLKEPDRVTNLQENGQIFLKIARENGIDVGTAHGLSILPAITCSSLKAVRLSNKLYDRSINVQPIVHPAVEEKAARLRFFISSMHSEKNFEYVCDCIRESL